MAGFMKLFSYKEPKNQEMGFELLENENEGTQQEKVGKDPSTSNTHQKKWAPLLAKWTDKTKKEKSAPSREDQMSSDITKNLETIRKNFLMPKNKDINIRELRIGRKYKAFVVYIEGMVDKKTLNLSIFPQLMEKNVFDELGKENPLDFLMQNVLTVHMVRRTNLYSDAILQVLSGMSALFVEDCKECILIDTKGFAMRSVQPPITETVILGSQEAFTENLRTNVSMVRRIIKNKNLVSEFMAIGSTSHSQCTIMYLEGVANPKVIEEVKKRLNKISTDLVLGNGMIEQFIEDNSFMLFPQILSTERPDRTASFIIEGQVVIIADGTPFALTVPVTFFRLLHTSEDMLARWPFGAFLRFVRLFGLFCATLLPGLYVAAVLFHIEMMPTMFVESIVQAKESVPFPTVVEILIMEGAFELIREGGVRVPSVIGQTLGIVGALILGQAAVGAGLVSPMMVIIVSITALGNFAIPNYSLALAIRIERFLFIIVGSLLGFYGIALIMCLLAYLACSMKSFGVPFFSPIAPRTKVNPDVVLRTPIWMQKNRADYMNTGDRKKQGPNVKLWATMKTHQSRDKGDKT